MSDVLRYEVVDCGDYKLRFDPPLRLEVTKQNGIYFADEDSMNIHLFTVSRAKLRQLVVDHVDVLWRDYALADDAALTGDAQEIKRWMLARASVVVEA